ncbi:unnamed protein product [Musa acuminata var. zebrina]
MIWSCRIYMALIGLPMKKEISRAPSGLVWLVMKEPVIS